jgi:hypothetical protein
MSCWAFSSIASVEGGLAVNTGWLVPLSEQDLLTCDVGGAGGVSSDPLKNGQNACLGGEMNVSFAFLETTGICTEAEAPYAYGEYFSGDNWKALLAAAEGIVGEWREESGYV